MNVNMLHINFQPKQLWIADEGLKCLTHRLESRRGTFPLLFLYTDKSEFRSVGKATL